MRYAWLCFFILPFTATRGQSSIPGPESFINAVVPKVIDSTRPHYFLLSGTDSGRFVKYNYDDWADTHLSEPVPISILNELAGKVYHSRNPYFWKQDSLTSAICITRHQADSILYLDPPDGDGTPNHVVFSFSLPQFTDDGKFAVIDLNMVCGGRCGVGTTCIFHDYPSGWKLVGQYTNWKTITNSRTSP